MIVLTVYDEVRRLKEIVVAGFLDYEEGNYSCPDVIANKGLQLSFFSMF